MRRLAGPEQKWLSTSRKHLLSTSSPKSARHFGDAKEAKDVFKNKLTGETRLPMIKQLESNEVVSAHRC